MIVCVNITQQHWISYQIEIQEDKQELLKIFVADSQNPVPSMWVLDNNTELKFFLVLNFLTLTDDEAKFLLNRSDKIIIDYLKRFDAQIELIAVKFRTKQPNSDDCGVHTAIRIYNAIQHQVIDSKDFENEPYSAEVGFRLFMMNTIVDDHQNKIATFVKMAKLTQKPFSTKKQKTEDEPVIITQSQKAGESIDLTDESDKENTNKK